MNGDINLPAMISIIMMCVSCDGVTKVVSETTLTADYYIMGF